MDKFFRKSSWFLLLILMFLFSGCLPRLPKIQIPEASVVFDSKGKIISSIFQEENRLQVPLEQVSPFFTKAILAVEDSRFYRHIGIDPYSIARAMYANIKSGRLAQGGSTITQQTVKNLFLTPEKSFRRKLKEAYLTFQLERKYSKDEILEMYVNSIYFGEGAYGVETASQTYFGKSAKDLDLAESALLAGLPRSPNRYSPFQNRELAINRQNIVLDRMVEVNYISAEKAEKAKKEALVFRSTPRQYKKAPYVIDEVTKFITSRFDEGAKMLFQGGLHIYTTIDQEMQEAADEAVAKGLAPQPATLEGALVAIDPRNGQIRAMVGGRDFARSKFNRATLAKRQPGSAFKPFLYATAIEKGYTAASMLPCEPISIPQAGEEPYTPTDYGAVPYHYRLFTLWEALVISDNVVSIRLNQETGPDSMAAMARNMGIKSPLRPYLSLALGTSEVTPLEMATGFIPLANRGLARDAVLITKVTDRDGNVLYEDRSRPKGALSEETAYVVTDMLKGVLRPGGTASQVSTAINRPAAGKTGTTQNYRDAWFVGYTPQLVTAVFIGYDQPAKPVGLTGGSIAAPIWADFVNAALAKTSPDDFPVPEGVVRIPVNLDNGRRAGPQSLRVQEMAFVRGTEPEEAPLEEGGFLDRWDFGREQPQDRDSRRRGRTPGGFNWRRFFFGY